jgi:hypothetical protein
MLTRTNPIPERRATPCLEIERLRLGNKIQDQFAGDGVFPRNGSIRVFSALNRKWGLIWA